MAKFLLSKLMFIVTGVSLFLPLSAGHDSSGPPVLVYLMGGKNTYDLRRLNDTIKGMGLDPFPECGTSAGLGGNYGAGRLLLDCEAQVSLWRPCSKDNRKITLWAGQLAVATGVDLLPSSGSFRFFPFFAAGGGMLSMSIGDDSVAWTGALDATRGSSFRLISLTTATGLGLVAVLPAGEGKGLFTIGIKSGLLFDIGDDIFTSGNFRLNGMNAPVFNGPFVQVLIGKGWNGPGRGDDGIQPLLQRP